MNTDTDTRQHPWLCTDCFETRYGDEPDMGDMEYIWQPGTCDGCGSDRGHVWLYCP